MVVWASSLVFWCLDLVVIFRLWLMGTEIDYIDGLSGKGFKFVNPNAKRTCGCGESFSV
mgnify:CR=1 FL=1